MLTAGKPVADRGLQYGYFAVYWRLIERPYVCRGRIPAHNNRVTLHS